MSGRPRIAPGVRRALKTTGIAVVAVLCLAALSLALPVSVWRTGRLPAPPLPLVEGGPEIEPARRVWIDTDAACGEGRRADPDDCLAVLLLARAPEIEIVGISSVFGNAGLADTDRTARALARILRNTAPLPEVLRGAGAPDAGPTQAMEGLRGALADGPLTILALGPLTNVTAALGGRPDLQRNVRRVVAVMGRRPGHIFHPSEGEGEGMLFGHGPIFRDLNFDMDRNAAVDLLDMGLPISLVPYDVARGINLTGDDLDRIARSGDSGSWIASRARGWLEFWKKDIGLEGFYPFDLMAAAYVLRPEFFDCAAVPAWVDHDDRLNNFWFFDPVALQVGLPEATPPDALAQTEAIYCVRTDTGLRGWLMGRLAKKTTRTDNGDTGNEATLCNRL